MKNIFVFLISSLALASCFTMQKTEAELNVGVPAEWGDLVPSLQHTAYADAILSNEYETLVRLGENGSINPLAAKSWTINKDYTEFTFKIDTNKKFSNGKNLEAKDFKQAWESALLLTPKSANSSLQDVLYNVIGYEEFKKIKTLSGISVPEVDTLIIKFKKPFRTALVYLAGARMAVVYSEKDKHFGTGPYQLSFQSNGHATFQKNKYCDNQGDFEKVNFIYVPNSDAAKALKENKIQLFIFAEKSQIDDCQNKDSDISCNLGSASRHFTFMTNGKAGSFFNSNNHRKALQALIFKSNISENLPERLKQTMIVDPQLFLPYQKGRISSVDAQEIIDEGKSFIPGLISASKARPILIKSSETEKWVIDYLKKLGVAVDEKSGPVSSPMVNEIYYKKHSADLLVIGLSVISGDPDGIYHALGKDGSIASPMSYRKNLSQLLEVGRTLLDSNAVNKKYQEVNQEALRSVPFIHLGFLKTRIAFRNDKIKVKEQYKDREDDRIISFTLN